MCKTRVSNGVAGAAAPPARARLEGWLSAVGCALACACLPLEDPSSYTGGVAIERSEAEPREPPAMSTGGAGGTGSTPRGGTPGEGTPIQGLSGAGGRSPGGCTAGSACNSGNGGAVPVDTSVPPQDSGLDAGSEPVPERPPECAPGETTGPDGDCYVAVLGEASWDDARIACQARGAGWDLTTIRNAEQSSFLAAFSPQETWVGGADLTTEGTWAWVTDGFAFWVGAGNDANRGPLNGAFTNWFTDEPNGEGTSDCMRVLIGGTWGDLECTELRRSVCEGPPR